MTELLPILTRIGRDEISWPLALYAFMESAAVYLRFVHGIFTPYGFPPYALGISSDYETFLEAVKAAKAYEDDRAIGLLDKSEQAIEEVVSIFDEPCPICCSYRISGLQAQAWGMSFVVVCGKPLIYPPVNPSLT